MHLRTFRIRNYRRLKDVQVDLDDETTIFVGSNNSGKTSATHIFQAFLGSSNERFSIHDFSADCWAVLNRIGSSNTTTEETLPSISLDLWFDVQDNDLHRVINILPSLDWKDAPVGVRLEFAAKDSVSLLTTFREARNNASKFVKLSENGIAGFHPWPKLLTDYLMKRLSDEYKIYNYVLDHKGFDSNFQQSTGYQPGMLGTDSQAGASLLKSLLRVDFMTAQRHLSDSESSGRVEGLSKRLSHFYERNLQKHDDDYEAVAALASSEAHFNDQLSKVIDETLKSLNALGYPGLSDPHLIIKSAFNPESILTKNASVHYALKSTANSIPEEYVLTLPDRYNGLGFKNLIYMVVEVLDFYQRWADTDEDRPPLHLIFIEEPEAHLHAQLQQVFIRKIRDILPNEAPEFACQLVITTHSPHIIYESSFTPIRYFRRSPHTERQIYSDVLNLSAFYKSESESRDFLLQYMKLTHCDLFFADGAVLVEGNVERLLLPLMIEKSAAELRSNYLSILELGGSFSHKFKPLIHFLGLTTLIITDLDSVFPRAANPTTGGSDDHLSVDVADEGCDEAEESDGRSRKTCMTIEPTAVTSNQTLATWLPRMKAVADLLNATAASKSPVPTATAPARVCVAYQTRQTVKWNGETKEMAGRTFEEAFAYENLEWCQDVEQKSLHLRVQKKATTLTLDEITQKIHDRVKSDGFDKTDFALCLMMADRDQWKVPNYIAVGLEWLAQHLAANSAEPVAVVGTSGEEPGA